MRRFLFILCAAAFLAAVRLPAQTTDTPTQLELAGEPTAPPTDNNNNQAAPNFLTNHLDVTTFQLMGRFIHIRDTNNELLASKLQWALDLKGDFKFDTDGNYLIHTRVTSGQVTSGGFNDTGLGLGSQARSNIYVKRLYFQARPLRGVEFQVGSLPFFRGEATSVTHYDEGAFIVGERLSLRRPDQLYFDEITYTVGYLGASFTPNVLMRMPRLGQINYHQYLVEKKFDKRVAASLEYSNQYLESVFREAVKVHVSETKVLDSVRVEFYQRMRVVPGNGFNLVGEKAITSRLTVSLGWAAIDQGYVGFNNEMFNIGRHAYATGRYQLTRDWAVGVFATRGVFTDYYLTNSRRFDIIVYYNALDAIKRSGLLRRFS